MDEKQEEKFIRMTQTPIPRLICAMAAPCIISMLVTAFYNMADTFFVGMLNSNSATGAVGVVFSVMAIIQAIGFFCGHGSGNYISRELGMKNIPEASRMAANGFVTAFLLGCVVAAGGLIFLEPLALFLGSTETILPYTMSYMRFILIGAPWMCSSLVLNNQLRFQGSAVYGMVGITSGAVLNIALDPIFIFGLDMGVSGAALATILSQLVSFFILLYQCSRPGNLGIHLSELKLTPYYLKEIAQGGLPSLARQGLSGLSTICLNWAAGPYGDAAIAAMGVVARVMQFAYSSLLGFGQGMQPVAGFNYGAQLYGRVKEGFWFCIKCSVVVLIALGTVGAIFAPSIIAIFRDDPTVIEYGALALRLQCMTIWISSWVVMSNMVLQVTAHTVPATCLSMARQGIFFIPTILILPGLLDSILGVQLAQPISDILAAAMAIPLMRAFFRDLDRREAEKTKG